MSGNTGMADTCNAITEYEENADFSAYKTDIKLIALYLPQLHSFPEKDACWGEGFTGRDSIRKGEPGGRREDGCDSVQNDADTLRKQAAFAKAHGIYGFGIDSCLFSSAQLRKNPAELLLENKDIDMPFFLVWGNEDRAQANDGEHGICIRRLKEYADDHRYIRIDGKPVIGLYAQREIPDVRGVLRRWRQAALDTGIGEIYLLLFASGGAAAELQLGNLVDGEYAAPSCMQRFAPRERLLNDEEERPFAYLVESERAVPPAGEMHDRFRGIAVEWDCSGTGDSMDCWRDFSFALLDLWLKEEIVYSRKYLGEDRRFLFFNAWSGGGKSLLSGTGRAIRLCCHQHPFQSDLWVPVWRYIRTNDPWNRCFCGQSCGLG